MPPRSSCACSIGRGGGRSQRIALPEYTDEVWHGYLPEAYPGLLYGYRVHGPYEPAAGHRFNPNKLLLDPYAKALRGQLRWSDAHLRLPAGQRPRGSLVRPARQRPRHAQMRRGRRRLYLGRRPAARRALGRDDHLRDPRARHDHAPPGGARAAARHVRRPRPSGGDRPSGQARHHRDRADADAGLRPGPASARPGSQPTTGATTRSASSRRSSAIWRAARSANSRPWSSASTTPASRSSWTSSTITPPRATTSARRCRSAASTTRPTTVCMPDNPRFYVDDTGMRQHHQHEPRARAGAGHRFAALLGRADARRRLPLRPRHDARARGAAASIRTAASSTRSGRTACWAASS